MCSSALVERRESIDIQFQGVVTMRRSTASKRREAIRVSIERAILERNSRRSIVAPDLRNPTRPSRPSPRERTVVICV